VDDGDLVKMQGVQNFRRSLSFLHFTNSDFNIYAYDYLFGWFFSPISSAGGHGDLFLFFQMTVLALTK
jgi:hypothetical protein